MKLAVLAPDDLRERITRALTEDGIGIEEPGVPDVDAIVLAVSGANQSEADLAAAVRDARGLAESARVILVVDDLAMPTARALDAGATGVVWVTRVEATLSATVAAVAVGQLVVPHEIYARGRRPALSAREKQVLALVVLGLSNGEIATKLYLTESTVKSHLATAFKKLDVSSRKQAVERILDPADGLGIGILSITQAERISDS